MHVDCFEIMWTTKMVGNYGTYSRRMLGNMFQYSIGQVAHLKLEMYNYMGEISITAIQDWIFIKLPKEDFNLRK